MMHHLLHLYSRRGRLGAAALLFLLLAVGAGACGGCGSDDSSTDEKADDEQQRAERTDESAADDEPEYPSHLFGLPLPPQVVEVQPRGEKMRVKTKLSLSQVQTFFENRFTDFEILTPGHEIRAVGLRDYMPEAYAYGVGPQTYIVYIPPNRQDDATDADAGDKTSPRAAARAKAGDAKPLAERRRGEKVLDRTSDGELLAPGARWGEPYTPPPGSPLHQERYRSNFGRPYGEWILQ